MPWWKFVGNRALTFLNGALLGMRLSEFHTGYRVYSAPWTRLLALDALSNDFGLGFQMFGEAVKSGWPVAEVPAFSKYFPEASSNPLGGSIKYGVDTLTESLKIFLYRVGLAAARRRQS
jgi:hypothetical protein